MLVGGWATPLKNMISSIGMIIPNIWETKKWQPNHQPACFRQFNLTFRLAILFDDLTM